jgi:hypothetical protein
MLRRIVTVYVPWVLASIVGVLVLIHFFIAIPGLDPFFIGLVEWASIIAGFAILLGLINVARDHVQRVVQRKSGWGYSIALVLSALMVIVLGMLPGSSGQGDPLVQWVFRYVLEPLATTFFSLLAFFLASAFFRALRLRNLEATLVTVAAVIVLLGQIARVPPWTFLGTDIIRFQQWLVQVPAMAGVRAILLGSAIGAISTAMRVILGLERPYVE